MSLQLERLGHATALGAVSILNATATGVGCSLAINRTTSASWSRAPSAGVHEDALVRAVVQFVARRHDWPAGMAPTVVCPFPPSRGLKTSSSTAAALLQAAYRAVGSELSDEALIQAAVDVSLAAGVTLTGAFDDQVAVVCGGAHLTDNRMRRVIEAMPTEPWQVAIWVPDEAIPKARLAGVNATSVAVQARAAEALARRGDLPGAMTLNGQIFTNLYRAHGLPVDDRPAEVALASGALGAGLSGTGPAVAALFDNRVRLSAVPGGTWQWAQVASAP